MGIAQWFGAAAQKIENPIKDGSLKAIQIQKDSQSQLAKGPYAALEGSKFDVADLRFPLDLGTSIDKLHYIKFFVNVQERSKYNVQERTDLGSTINQNRARDLASGVGNLASTDGVAKSLNGGGRILMDAVGGAAFGKAAAQIGGEIFGVYGAVAGGVAGGLVGATVVESIDISRKTKRIKSTISLYIPQGSLNSDMSHTYSDVSMKDALGLVGAIGQGGSAIGTSIVETLKEFTGAGTSRPELRSAGSGAMSELGGKLAAKSGIFGEGIEKTMMFSAGLAQNPQVEFMYESTGHREFQFAFKFIPKNKTEAEAVRNIIKQFRFHASPELLPGSTGRYFIPPAEFDIQFYYGGRENTNIPKISTCVLTGIQVQMSESAYATFQDGMPVETVMTLKFQELELMYKQRIEEGY